MTTTQRSTMAATLKASVEGLERVDKARRKKGWAKTEPAWADQAHTSGATLKRFWAGIAIQSEAFRDICGAVGIDDWESLIDSEDDDKSESMISSKRLAFAIAGSIDETDSEKLKAIVALLRKLGGDTTIEILDVDEGSIKLILGGSEEALKRIEALFEAGELTEIEGIDVQDVHFLDQEELVSLIHKNGGAGLNLSKANLIRADLIGADLDYADLIGANLSDADLRSADLNDANLSDANLSDANLSDANLSDANLSDADLSGANLREARLIATDLRESQNLTPEQLTGEKQPYLCGVALPSNITNIDPNRDCDVLPQILERYGITLERAEQLIEDARNKKWD
jgi:hypothetical protein